MINKIVRQGKFGIYPPFNKKNYPCDVLIISGEYMGEYGLSNYWTWKRILKNGKLGPIESGYGDFTKPKGKYKVKISIFKK
jgi:hypothetical protein